MYIFLKEHPSEVVIFRVRWETDSSRGYSTIERFRAALGNLFQAFANFDTLAVAAVNDAFSQDLRGKAIFAADIRDTPVQNGIVCNAPTKGLFWQVAVAWTNGHGHVLDGQEDNLTDDPKTWYSWMDRYGSGQVNAQGNQRPGAVWHLTRASRDADPNNYYVLEPNASHFSAMPMSGFDPWQFAGEVNPHINKFLSGGFVGDKGFTAKLGDPAQRLGVITWDFYTRDLVARQLTFNRDGSGNRLPLITVTDTWQV